MLTKNQIALLVYFTHQSSTITRKTVEKADKVMRSGLGNEDLELSYVDAQILWSKGIIGLINPKVGHANGYMVNRWVKEYMKYCIGITKPDSTGQKNLITGVEYPVLDLLMKQT